MAQEDILHPEGVYNPTLRFAWTNITEEPFSIMWDGAIVSTVGKNQTVELPQYLAVTATKALVDKIMIGNAKLDEITHYKNNPNVLPNMYRASSSLGVPAARKVWEDQICRVLEQDEESPQIQVMRAEIREQLKADLSAESSAGSPLDNAPRSIEEFADLTAPKVEVEKKSNIKVKTISK